MSVTSSLRFVIAPLLAMGLGLAVFELSGLDVGALCAAAGAPAAKDAAAHALALRESVIRLMWLGTVFGYVAAVGATAAVSVITLGQAGPGGYAGRRVTIPILLAVAIGCLTAYGAASGAGPAGASGGACAAGSGGIIMDITGTLPVALLRDFYESTGIAGPRVGAFSPALNGLGAFSIALALLAATATMASPGGGGRGQIREGTVPAAEVAAGKMRRLRWLLEVICVQFVIGILQMLSWLRLPASVASDPQAGAGLAELAWGVSLYWGVVFSVAIAAWYVPVVHHLSSAARRAIDATPAAERPPDTGAWLREHALSGSLSAQLPQALAIAAPMLAVPVGKLLTNWMVPVVS